MLLLPAAPAAAQEEPPGEPVAAGAPGDQAEGAAGGAAEAPALDPLAAQERLASLVPEAGIEPALRSYLLALAASAVGDHRSALADQRRALTAALEAPTATSRLVALAAIQHLSRALYSFPPEWVEPAAELADRVPLPDATWLPVLMQLLRFRGEIGYMNADVPAAERDAAARGCVTDWVGTGPQGPTGTDQWWRDPPDGTFLHPAAWEPPRNSPARPERSWKPEPYLCTMRLGRKDETRPGALRLAAVADFAADLQAAVLSIDFDGPFLVRIDGTEVARVDPYREPSGSAHDFLIAAPAGRHRIDLQFASPGGRPGAVVRLLGLDAAGRAVPLPASTDLSVETPPAFLGSVGRVEIGSARGWAALPALDAAEGLGRAELVARAAEKLAESDFGRDNPFVRLRAAEAVLSDPMLTVPEGRRRASTHVDAIGPLAEGLLLPRLIRARWAMEDGDLDDAIDLLREAGGTFPGEPQLLGMLREAYSSRGWTDEARRTLEAIAAALPGSCGVRQLELAQAYEIGDNAAIREAAREMVRCRPSAFDWLDVLSRERRWAEATEEIERLRPLYSDPDAPDVARASMRLRQGDTTGLEELLRRLLREDPADAGRVSQLANLLLREGRDDEARALWEETLVRGLPDDSGALEAAAALRGADPYSALFVPAQLAIAAYEARRGPEEAPSTQILDHTVSLLRDDGTILMLTHTILKLSSQEAIEAYGQSGGGPGRALLARTIAPDGSVTEAVDIAQGRATSFPELTPGCYLETFSARLSAPSPLLQGGTDHWRFYFQSRDETMARTEFVLAAPAGYPLEFSSRAEAPEHRVADVEGLRIHRWADRDVAPLHVEPYSVESDAYVPSVRAASGYTWDLALAALGDAIYPADYVPLEAAAFAREQCAGLAADGCARRLYAWILDNVEAGDFGESIAASFQRRSGGRARLFVALLRAAGWDAGLLLATSFERDRTETTVAEAGRFYYPVVALADGTYLTIEADEAPFGYLPPEIRGMPAARFDPRGEAFETVALPDASSTREEFAIDLDLTVDPDTGDVAVRGSVGIGGSFGADIRDGLLERSPADREGDLTRLFVAGTFPDADVESIAIDALEDRETPLVARFSARARGLAVRRGGSLLLPPLVPQALSQGYAPLPVVEHPAFAFPPLRIDLRVRVHAAGFAAAAPPGVEVDAAGVKLEQEVLPEDDGATIRRTLSVAQRRLEPDEYPEFARAVRRAESLWNMPVELRRER